MNEDERRHVWGLAWAVREFGEEDLEAGVTSELAAGVLALYDELAEARAWARAQHSKRWDRAPIDRDSPPDWLTVD